jgi:putative alpha-1,2-mannosidase
MRSAFDDRGMVFDKDTEVRSPSYYKVEMQALEGGKITAEQSASAYHLASTSCFCNLLHTASRVGHLRFTYTNTSTPFVFIEATRASVMGSADPTNVTYPSGNITIDSTAREICGSNPERQDFIIGPNAAPSFAGHFCARFDIPFSSVGITQNGTRFDGKVQFGGVLLGGYAMFDPNTTVVNVRIGVSFISIDQARKNIEDEIPDGTALEETARTTRTAWAEKLDRIQIEGATDDQLSVFYTAVYHALQVRTLTRLFLAF